MYYILSYSRYRAVYSAYWTPIYRERVGIVISRCFIAIVLVYHHNGKTVCWGFTPPSRSYRKSTSDLRPHDTSNEPAPRPIFHTDSLGFID